MKDSDRARPKERTNPTQPNPQNEPKPNDTGPNQPNFHPPFLQFLQFFLQFFHPLPGCAACCERTNLRSRASGAGGCPEHRLPRWGTDVRSAAGWPPGPGHHRGEPGRKSTRRATCGASEAMGVRAVGNASSGASSTG